MTPRSLKPVGILPANRRALALGLVTVAALGIGTAGTILALRSRLPDPIANHYTSSVPDGFASATATAWIALAFTIGMGAFFVTASVMFPGERWVRRLAFGFSISLAALLTLVFLIAVIPQAGLDDATEARINWGLFLVPIVASPALGWLMSSLVRE
jgi:hypothetical protein